MTRAESAYELMLSGKVNCAQAVLTAFCEDLGLDRTLALKLAMGFGGGMRAGKTCGAVTGAYMVIGLRQKEITPETKDKVYNLVVEFNKRFCRLNRSTACRELLGLDLSVPEDYAAAKQEGVFKTLCPKFVKDSVTILEEGF